MNSNFSKLVAMLVGILATSAVHSAPPLVNYQGFLTDSGGQPLNDVTSVTFRIWTKVDAASSTVASDLVWAEKHEAVSVVDGRINVILGNGTPVTTDLTAATSAVENLGDAFREDATYIGITINDANNLYDPGEEITPRQQLLSVPYALNGGGSVISGFQVAPQEELALLRRVVEVVPKTKQLQLADDLAAKQWYTRGIYLGSGRIQVSGSVPSYRDDLVPGAPVYLSAITPGSIVDADSPDLDGRPFATLVGFGASNGEGLQLNFQYTQLAADILLTSHRRPLQSRNFDFTTNEYWNTFNFENPSNPNPALTQFYNSGCRGGNGVLPYKVKIYQVLSLTSTDLEYLHPLIDAGGLQVTYGCWAYGSQGTKGRIRLDFYDETPAVNIPPGFDFDEFDFLVPSGACNQLLNSEPTCVPPDTRFIGVSFWSPDNTSAQFDDIVLELATVTSPGACP